MHLDDDGELVLDAREEITGPSCRRERRGPGLPGRRAADRLRHPTMRRIVVVGNGIAGLTAATRCAERASTAS